MADMRMTTKDVLSRLTAVVDQAYGGTVDCSGVGNGEYPSESDMVRVVLSDMQQVAMFQGSAKQIFDSRKAEERWKKESVIAPATYEFPLAAMAYNNVTFQSFERMHNVQSPAKPAPQDEVGSLTSDTAQITPPKQLPLL